jgi:restriction system protein
LPLLILELIISGIIKRAKYNSWKKKKYSAQDFINSAEIEFVDVMEGYVFEQFLKTLFFYLGYDALVTKRSGDYGADVVMKKDGRKIVVQAKRYNKNVGSKAVQEIVVARNHYNADEAMVVTNSYFTKQAEEIADENGVILIDRNELKSLINEAKYNIETNYDVVSEECENINENFDNKYKYRI